jgi:hypothetical protein
MGKSHKPKPKIRNRANAAKRRAQVENNHKILEQIKNESR